jgi:glycosyltransferase involved in cell wall biosynthesis
VYPALEPIAADLFGMRAGAIGGSPATVRILAVDGQSGACATPGRKGLADAVAVCRELRQAGYDLGLTVVGPSEPIPPAEWITVLPAQPRDDLLRLLQRSEILLFLSRQDSFGYLLLEAMSNGLCCVAASGPSLPAVKEIIEDGVNGFLVNYLQEREYPEFSIDLNLRLLRNILAPLLLSREKRLQMGEAARAQFGGGGKFSVSRRNDQLVGFVRARLDCRFGPEVP